MLSDTGFAACLCKAGGLQLNIILEYNLPGQGCQPSCEDKRNVRSDPLAVYVTARVGTHHPVRGFRLAFWCRRAPNCTIIEHQVRQRVGKMSKFAKCSSLAWFYEQTLYGAYTAT